MKETEIETFLEVIETGSISAAAESLYITQPALSRRISSLEDELGYKLFLRNKGVRNIELTPEGKSFIVLAKKWKALFLESKGLTDFSSRAYDFHLGVIGSISTYLLPATFKHFINTYPECNLSIHQHHSDECYSYTEKGILDLALVGKERYSKTIVTIPIMRSPFKLVSKSINFSKGAVHPSQLDTDKEIFVPWSNRFENWHDYWYAAHSHPRVWLDMMQLLENFIVEDNSWVIAPTYIASYLAAKLELKIYDLLEPPPAITIYAIYPKENSSPYVKQFLQAVKTSLEPNQAIQLWL